MGLEPGAGRDTPQLLLPVGKVTGVILFAVLVLLEVVTQDRLVQRILTNYLLLKSKSPI